LAQKLLGFGIFGFCYAPNFFDCFFEVLFNLYINGCSLFGLAQRFPRCWFVGHTPYINIHGQTPLGGICLLRNKSYIWGRSDNNNVVNHA